MAVAVLLRRRGNDEGEGLRDLVANLGDIDARAGQLDPDRRGHRRCASAGTARTSRTRPASVDPARARDRRGRMPRRRRRCGAPCPDDAAPCPRRARPRRAHSGQGPRAAGDGADDGRVLGKDPETGTPSWREPAATARTSPRSCPTRSDVRRAQKRGWPQAQAADGVAVHGHGPGDHRPRRRTAAPVAARAWSASTPRPATRSPRRTAATART